MYVWSSHRAVGGGIECVGSSKRHVIHIWMNHMIELDCNTNSTEQGGLSSPSHRRPTADQSTSVSMLPIGLLPLLFSSSRSRYTTAAAVSRKSGGKKAAQQCMAVQCHSRWPAAKVPADCREGQMDSAQDEGKRRVHEGGRLPWRHSSIGQPEVVQGSCKI